MKGVKEALELINLPMCVASSGSHTKMRTTLGLTGLMGKFEGKIYSVTEVKNAKPYPDVFLHPAKKMGFTANKTAVVEDSSLGVGQVLPRE